MVDSQKIIKLKHALKYKGSTMTGSERERIRQQIAYLKQRDELWDLAQELGISLAVKKRRRKGTPRPATWL